MICWAAARTQPTATSSFANSVHSRFTTRVLLELMFGRARAEAPLPHRVQVGARSVSLLVVRNPRARRYLLRLRPDGSARVTVPRGGSLEEARRFIERNTPWLEQQLQRLDNQTVKSAVWAVGTEIFFRGQKITVRRDGAGHIRFGDEVLPVTDLTANLRPVIERRLRQLANRELPLRVLELATLHGFTVRRVTVRNQRTRWGSCSRRATISLNWRLIQTPAFVQDYVVLHELAHLREMNHSTRFWRGVEQLCPDYRRAELWLKQHSELLR
jgi:predicted metal-dependent hydrolase